MYTHWACFDCRKSFSKDESTSPRKCPECAEPMVDMGAYFPPPRKAAKKRWDVMRVLADRGYKFNSRQAQEHIERHILQVKNPRVVDVMERIELERQRQSRDAD